MSEEKKEEKKKEAISRRKYLSTVGGLAAAAAVGWGVAGYLASRPPAPAAVKTVTETTTVTPPKPLNIKFVKTPTVGVFEQPVVTVVVENPWDETKTETYTLIIDGKKIETKTFTIPPHKVKACWFEPPPFTEPGTHEVKVAGVTQTLKVSDEITTVYEKYPGKIWLDWHGYTPFSLADIEKLVTPELKEKIKRMHLKWAYNAHDIADYWIVVSSKVIKDLSEEYGMEMLAITSADWDTEKEIKNVETIIALKPDILFSMPTDFEGSAEVHKRAAKAGIRIVYTDDRPEGFEWPRDYAGVDTCDYRGYHLLALESMANMLRKSTKKPPYKVLQFYFGYYFLPVTTRDEITELFIKERPDEFVLVHREGFTDPDAEVLNKTETLLPTYPDLDAIVTPWSMPGMSAIRAAMALGRTDIIHATSDIGDEIAMEMAKPGPPYVALGMASWLEQAKIKFYIGVLDKAGVKLPGPVGMALPIPVNRKNLLEIYRREWAEPLGKEVPKEMEEWLKEEEELP